MDTLSAVVMILGLALIIYFIPSFLALRFNHTNRIWIFIANLLLGWTFVIWLALIVWAFNDWPVTIKPFTRPRPTFDFQ